MSERVTAEAQPLVVQKASAAQVGRAVFWSFIGIRKQSEFHTDGNSVKPVHVIVVGLLLALLFVLGLITVINLVV